MLLGAITAALVTTCGSDSSFVPDPQLTALSHHALRVRDVPAAPMPEVEVDRETEWLPDEELARILDERYVLLSITNALARLHPFTTACVVLMVVVSGLLRSLAS